MTALAAILSRPIAERASLSEVAFLSLTGLLVSAILMHFGINIGAALQN